MTALYPDIDPAGLLEYSVVYTDRALNHMSRTFQGVMKEISRVLKTVYHAQSAIVVPQAVHAAAPISWAVTSSHLPAWAGTLPAVFVEG